MPLPVLGQFMRMPTAHSQLAYSPQSHPPVTDANDQHIARYGNAEWQGNTLMIGNEGRRNYWFIPDKVDGVSYCVVPANGFGEAYVLSTNYGGCHLASLWHPGLRQLAFLHIYKGAGPAAPFRPAEGWQRGTRISSFGLIDRFSPSPVWSITCIDRRTNPPTVQSKFIGCRMPALVFAAFTGEGRVNTGTPPVEVVHEDPGLPIDDWD